MDISNRTSEGTMQERYLRRINGLGKCLVLWASQYSEFGSSDPWHYTKLNVDHLMNLIDAMSTLAVQIVYGVSESGTDQASVLAYTSVP